MRPIAPTSRTAVRRSPQRGSYDRATIHAILDEALVCHVGLVDDGLPRVLPFMHARLGDQLYLHGAVANHLLRAAIGSPVCLTATLLDGLVLARSALHHSMNYRSVVVYGEGRPVDEEGEKRRALAALLERVLPGRSEAARPPSDPELRATQVVALAIDEASAKLRSGPVVDEEEDLALPVWAGVLPLALVAGAPEPDAKLAPGLATPAALLGYRRGG